MSSTHLGQLYGTDMFSPSSFGPSLRQGRFPEDREINTCFMRLIWYRPFGKWLLNENRYLLRNANWKLREKDFPSNQRNSLHLPNTRNPGMTSKRYIIKSWNQSFPELFLIIYYKIYTKILFNFLELYKKKWRKYI